jgi:hypothetical protein
MPIKYVLVPSTAASKQAGDWWAMRLVCNENMQEALSQAAPRSHVRTANTCKLQIACKTSESQAHSNAALKAAAHMR